MRTAHYKGKPQLHRRSVWAFVIISILVAGVLLLTRSFYDYKREVSQLEERLKAQALVVDEVLNTNLHSMSLIIENILREFNEEPANSSAQINHYLKHQDQLFPGILAVLIIDSHGRCTHSSRDELIGKSFVDREYFTHTRDATDKSRLFLSPPFKNLIGRLVINVTKPIIGKQGEFSGIVAVTMAPEYFTSLLKSTIYAPDNRIALIHSDGVVFTAIPDGTNSIAGQNLMKPGALFFQHILGGSKHSIQSGKSSTTGDYRVFFFKSSIPIDLRLDKHLVVAASRNLHDALLSWKISSGIQLSVYLLFSCVILIGTNTMLRRDAERSRLAEHNRALLDSIRAHIAILDKDAVIVSVNEAWKDFAINNRKADGEPPHHAEIGTNYIDVCRESSGAFSEQARKALDGIRSVLDGSAKSFTMEYPCHSPDTQRWFFMTVEPLRIPDGGVVVTHTNITELKHAMEEIKALKGIIPICSGCKKIRDDHGYWEQLEIYITEHSDAEFSHGLCPACCKQMYPEQYSILYPDKNSS